MDENSYRHINDVLQYCEDVKTGEKPACNWEILAVDRFLNELERQNDDDHEFYFDESKAVKPIKFIELLPHVKGHWSGRRGAANRITLEPWQKFIIANIFGWVSKKTGLRKYSIVYLCIPRKNGKSILAAGIGLYMLVEDGEFGAEIYCGATTEKQAWEVFGPAKKMVERLPAFKRTYGVTPHAKKLVRDKRGRKNQPDDSKFEPLIGKPGDGSSPSCAILDERHEHVDDVLYDAMLTGMGARLQPILLMITTAGTNPAGPCYQNQKELQKNLQSKPEDQDSELFGVIYSIDKDDDWSDEQMLYKANPNIGVSVGIDFLKKRLKAAIRSARNQNKFLIKHLNKWVWAKESWLNMVDWNRQADTSLKIDDFKEYKAIKGLDMSSKLDITADVTMFVVPKDGVNHYYFFGTYYIPEERIKEPENTHYLEWQYNGYIETCDDDTIDYDQVQDASIEQCKIFGVEEIAFDPWGATQIVQNMQKQNNNLQAVEVPQNYGVSDAMTEFERLLKLGRIHHDGNPALAWMMGNVVAKEIDDGKKIRPIKEQKENKIDGAVAAIMALSRVIVLDDNPPIENFLNDPITL